MAHRGQKAQQRRRARRALLRRNAILAAASGSTSLPLSDREAAWDAGAARKSLDAGQFGDAHFWHDSNSPADQITSYKLPFASAAGGTLTAIWRGVTAGAGALSGARGGVDIPSGDVPGVRAKINAYYTKAAKKYDDPGIKPPWQASADESAAELLAYAEVGAREGDDYQERLSHWRVALGEASPEESIELVASSVLGPPISTRELVESIAFEALGRDPEEYQHNVICECKHRLSEHLGADGPCTHEDGRGTCSCSAYKEMEVESSIDSITASLRDLVAASGPAVPALLLNFDMARGGPAKKAFILACVNDGLSALTAESWRVEPGTIDLTPPAGADLLFEGDGEYVVRLADGRVLHFEGFYGGIDLTVAAPSYAEARALVQDFALRFPSWAPAPIERDESHTIPLAFWTLGAMGPSRRRRILEASPWEEVKPNYPAALRDDLDGMMTGFEPGKGGQLLLWQGPAGTGKTWALRALISEWSDWAEFHYITDPDAFFVGSPEYMIDVLLAETYAYIDEPTGNVVEGETPETKWRVLILEDTGELLAASAKDKQGQGISRLLNVVDGLVGQGLKVLVLVTTNDELGDLHPAAQRPGRCAVRLSFGPFPADEASGWLGEEVEEELTLAEMYARQNGGTAAFQNEDMPPAPSAQCSCGHPAKQHAGEDMMGPCTAEGCDCTGFEMQQVEEGDNPEATTAAGVEDVAPPPEPETGRRWRATLCPEGTPTDDGRMFAVGAISWRELPLTLMAQTETQEGHDGAQVAGRIDRIWRDETDNLILAEGIFDDSEFGNEIARMVDDEVLRGISVDIAVRAAEVVPVDGNGEPVEGEVDPIEVLFGGQVMFVVTEGVIGAVTVCPFPAFAEASIALTASGDGERVATVLTLAHFELETALTAAVEVISVVRGVAVEPPALTAAAAGLVAEHPPAPWFDDPVFDGPTPLTVTDDGRVYGHAALWGTCHIGLPNGCTTAPRSETDYAYFLLKEVVVESGEHVDVGTITLDTSHAISSLTRPAAAAHYDHTGTAVADVAVGEDDYGIWFAGALRPDADAEKVRKLRGATISGDWRNVGGNLELVALLAVNVPGFPVPKPRAEVTVTASGEPLPVSLVATGLVPPDGDDEIELEAEADEDEEERAAFAAVLEAAREPLSPL